MNCSVLSKGDEKIIHSLIRKSLTQKEKEIARGTNVSHWNGMDYKWQ